MMQLLRNQYPSQRWELSEIASDLKLFTDRVMSDNVAYYDIFSDCKMLHDLAASRFGHSDPETPETPSSPSPPGGDAHVCGKCREEFIGLSDFIAHKKVCNKKKVVVFFDANENENYPPQDRLGFERYRNIQEVGLLSEEGSDGEGNMDQSEEEDENELQIDDNDIDNDMKYSNYNCDSGDDFNDNDSDNDDDGIDKMEKDLEERDIIEKYDLANRFPNLMFPFSQLMPNNNVVLEPIGATKAAVAQFAENNLSPSDLAVLHTTLYSLQQQQLVQLQLIQQLQQQLLMGGQMPSIPNSYLPFLTGNCSAPPISSILPLSSSAGINVSSVVEHSKYVSDDPFFRHKCRLCHKVFGSDSALQIHVRSHTGERPFKCNICGNRFSTRGNLKVHFERHRAKYPHIKMNPNPVPEYLDKMPMQPIPFMGPSFLTGAPVPPSLPTSMFHITPTISAPIPTIRDEPIPMISKSISEERRNSSPVSPTKSLTSPTPTATDTTERERKSPILNNTASHAVSSTSSTSPSLKPELVPEPKLVTPSPHTPTHFPMISPLPSVPPPPLTSNLPFDQPSHDPLVPSKMLESDVSDENLELYMEIDKSETSKLQQLVDNIENKMTDPNQCVICHRVLSCKSALQMHYRTHTGERPFRCKICSRAFTTKGNLKTHMGVHRMKPPLRMMHQCPVCHKSFTNLLVLQQHIRSHAGVPGPLPGMSPFNPFPHPPTSGWPMKMFDMGHKSHLNPEKELDLSRSSSLFGMSNNVKVEGQEDVNNNDDGDESGVDEYVDEEEMLEDELNTGEKDEKDDLQKFEEHPSGDSGAGSEEGQTANTEDETKTQQENEETSQHNNTINHSDNVSDDSGRSGSPKFDEHSPIHPESSIYSSLANNNSSPVFSTSLAALEERVRAIDSSMAQSPLNRFRPAFAMNGIIPPMTNGVRSPSPNSQFGSESGSDINDGSNPGTPALSVRSDCSSGSGIGLGALDLRGNMDKSTTCHVCFKAFACRSALEIHLRSHTKERPFKCQVCDRHFSTKGNMRQHMLTHKIRDLPPTSFSNGNASNDENTDNSNKRTEDSENDSDANPKKKLKLDGESTNQNGSNNNNNVSNDNPYLPPGYPHRPPDFFPFHFPPFMNGPAPSKLNEISVIQNLAGGLGHFPPMSTAADLTSPKSNSDSHMKSDGQLPWNRDSEKHESKLNVSGSGELDLSMKSTSSSGSPSNNVTSPDSISSWSSWKTMCHLCNKNFTTPTALEHHMQSYHLNGQAHKSVVA
ncbi:hypothetical protein KUTeg_019614 [Tegillarca granosa]|uniref:C2H2-type domain-containing protein n=1 Tax=Tegillarca granosa TaxID=220873 RepID=A0ABQ9ED52_TEGGR|nr:hypothetical protein KUTeg_019614 [Tegillarca granosa]